MKTESFKKIIVNANTIKTRYCCEFVKLLDSLKRKNKNTSDNMTICHD